MSDILNNINNFDMYLLLKANALIEPESIKNYVIESIGNNPLVRGFLTVFFLAKLWLSPDHRQWHSRMLAGLLATCVATVASVWLQRHMIIHVRPFLDPTLHLRAVQVFPNKDNWAASSFPSDTATFYFALAMIIFLEDRVAGTVVFLWSIVSVGFARVAMGYHYPSDIAGGLLLGSSSVYLSTRTPYLTGFFAWFEDKFRQRAYIIDALLVLFLADAYTLFEGSQGVVHGLRRIIWILLSADRS
jgi:undecaprenyl-diphosphatase